MQAFDQWLRLFERGSIIVSAVMLFGIMATAALDVVMRYFFNSPLGWSYDVISIYLMAGMFFFALSDTLNNHAHIALDILHTRMSRRVRHAVEIPGYVLVVVIFGAVTWLALNRTIESFRGGDVIAGRLDWPTWISMAFVAWGFFVLALRCVYRMIGHGLSALRGESIIALPPIAGAEDAP